MVFKDINKQLPTANEHHTDSKDLLRVRIRRYVTEANARQAAERKVKCRNVFRLKGWTAVGVVDVQLVRGAGKFVEPPDF